MELRFAENKKFYIVFTTLLVVLGVFVCFCGYKNYQLEQQRRVNEALAKGKLLEVEPWEVRHLALIEQQEAEYERRLKEESNSFYDVKPTWVETNINNMGEVGDYVSIEVLNPYSHKIEPIGVKIKNIQTNVDKSLYPQLNFDNLEENKDWMIIDLEIDLREYSRLETGFDYNFGHIVVKYKDFIYSEGVKYLSKDIVMPNEDFANCTVALKYRADKEIVGFKIGYISENIGYVSYD